jgi:enoyl-CoA hydratase
MPYETILTEVRDRVLHLTLNRPQTRNALSEQMKTELFDALHAAEADPGVGSIVLRGEGASFCSGHDFGDLAAEQRRAAEQTPLDIFIETQRADDPWAPLWNLSKPTLAQIHGHCIGGAMELAFNCDVAIAAADARIGYPPVRAQGSTGIHMWTYLVGPQWAKILMLTGDLIDGTTAAEIGLVAKAVPAAELADEVHGLARRMALVPHELQVINKGICNKALELMGRDRLQLLSLQADRFAYEGRAAAEWKRRLLDDGPREAVRWRDERFR